MKNILITLALMLTVGIGVSQAQREPYNDSQVPTVNSWALGLGFVYPRFCSVNITALSSDYGVYLSLQRNFSEHVGLRLKAVIITLKDNGMMRHLTHIPKQQTL